MATLECLFSEPNIRFEDDQVVWRALQAYRSAAAEGEARPVKGAGFADALIVFRALRIAPEADQPLNAICTFGATMRRFHTPHRREDESTGFRTRWRMTDPLLFVAAARRSKFPPDAILCQGRASAM